MAIFASTAPDRSSAVAIVPRTFTTEQCDALFAAILIDDEVDPETELPQAIRLDYPQRDLIDCFGLAHRLWDTGFDRDFLIHAAATLLREGDLDDADRLSFKHVRAKFKHLRYAHRLYAADPEPAPMLDRITITMGHLQDAFRNHRRGAAMLHAALLRIRLAPALVARLRREADHLVPIDGAGFRVRLEHDAARLAAFVAADRVTGRELHAARKIVGRQVSFYDTLRTLQPSADSFRMSRSLSAINGLMGALHDELVLARSRDRSVYDDVRFALPEPIRGRLAALVGRIAV